MIMSGCKCSVKMSVYERTDVDDQRAIEDTGIERSDRGQGDGGPVGEADGSERAPCVATTGSIPRGGSSCRGSQEQGEKACSHHVPEDTTEGDGAGRGSLCRTQPHPSDRDAGRARGYCSVTLHCFHSPTPPPDACSGPSLEGWPRTIHLRGTREWWLSCGRTTARDTCCWETVSANHWPPRGARSPCCS